ncbi:hypothetical protein AMQ83_11035, partial [Paenibacillus riograndensis]
MKKIKLLLVSVLAFASIASSASASPVNPDKNQQAAKTTTDVVVDGTLVGTRTTSIELKRESIGDNVTVNMISTTHYDLLPSATNEQKDFYQDKTESTVIEKADNQYYVDGVKLDDTATTEPIIDLGVNKNPLNALAASTDSGGIPEISHYYGNYQTYYFASYDSFKFWTGWGPAGNSVQKSNVSINNPYTSLAIMNISSFASYHSSMKLNTLSLMEILGLAAINIPDVIGAIVAGGAAAVQASMVYDAYNNAHDTLS